jgi:hypothetical protein
MGMPSDRCKICTSKWREEIDRMLDENMKHVDIVAWAKKNAPELKLNATNVSTHSRFHRPGRFEELLDFADERLKHIRSHYGGEIQLMERVLSLIVLDFNTQLLAGEKSVRAEDALRAMRELRELRALQLNSLPTTSLEKLGFFLYGLLRDDPELLTQVTEAARDSDQDAAREFVKAIERAGETGAEGEQIIEWQVEGDEDE